MILTIASSRVSGVKCRSATASPPKCEPVVILDRHPWHQLRKCSNPDRLDRDGHTCSPVEVRVNTKRGRTQDVKSITCLE